MLRFVALHVEDGRVPLEAALPPRGTTLRVPHTAVSVWGGSSMTRGISHCTTCVRTVPEPSGLFASPDHSFQGQQHT
jgi:hypothetical protein